MTKKYNTSWLTFNWKTQSVAAWNRELWFWRGVLHERLRRWRTLEEAIWLPKRKKTEWKLPRLYYRTPRVGRNVKKRKRWISEIEKRIINLFGLMKTSSRISAKDCPNIDQHTKSPEGYMSWHHWAREKIKTHKQIKCDGCDYYSIWIPR